ncbi:unnamed protein product [Blepharisma stoltei]|uniref:C2H2-type domain-containing protein n=1 Tax=Blepharisma stoltei TaxID=1481888 RepID=A0AAU9JLG9_9CILI|nr:unnamed protein product [Blepharisma stoltei]
MDFDSTTTLNASHSLSLQETDVKALPIVLSDQCCLKTNICKLCKQIFKSPKDLREHLVQEFKLDNETIGLLDIELGVDDYSDLHLDYSPIVDSPSLENPVFSGISCPKCLKSCKSQKGLQQHMGRAHINRKKKVKCEKCGKAFKHKHALRFHERQVHEKSTRVVCKYCGVSKYNKYTLASHIDQVHLKDAEFEKNIHM